MAHETVLPRMQNSVLADLKQKYKQLKAASTADPKALEEMRAKIDGQETIIEAREKYEDEVRRR